MPLTDIQREELSKAGFIEHELEMLEESLRETDDVDLAIDIDLASMRWQHAMKDRAAWVNDKWAKGHTTKEIEQILIDYYSMYPKLHPLDFLPRMQPSIKPHLEYKKTML